MFDQTFELQDEIAARVVTTLDVKLASVEQARIWHKCLTTPKARDHRPRVLHVRRFSTPWGSSSATR
jgi:hypothetical protein